MTAETGESMAPASQPLRDEHRALLPELGAMRAAADAVGTPAGGEELDRALRLLHRHLLPHMRAEEAVLYPTIDRITGHDATATMRHDHDEIRERIDALDSLRADAAPGDASTQRALRAALYGLDAIVRSHLAKEEDLFHPLLDELGADADGIATSIHEFERQLYRDAARPRPAGA